MSGQNAHGGNVKSALGLPINPARLHNEKMALMPFDEDYEALATAFIDNVAGSPQLFDMTAFGPFSTKEQFDEFMKIPGLALFALLLKQSTIKKKSLDGKQFNSIEVRDGTMAGVIGLLDAKPKHMSAELGPVG